MRLKTSIISNSNKNLEYVSKLLIKKQIVAIPTETVYGLAGRADCDKVIKNIYNIKQRPFDNPLIIHFKNIEDALKAIVFDERTEVIANKFWPGPLTIVAKRKDNKVSKLATAHLDTIAVRVPFHPNARKLLDMLDFPLAAPSANVYGKISPTCAADVVEELGGKISTILDGGGATIGLESTVIDVTEKDTKILRYGSVSKTKLKNLLGKIEYDKKIETIKSPGQVLSHYKPNKELIINANRPITNQAWLAFGKIPKNFKGHSLSLSKKKCLKEAARNLYSMLRLLDKKCSQKIIVQKIPNKGIGLAINDRLKRASFKKIDAIMSKKVKFLKEKLPKNIWEDKISIIEPYLKEERGRIEGHSSLLLRPKNTHQVSEILKICNKYNIKVVPQGGRTGLSGGTVPLKEKDQVVLSLERMDKVIKINKDKSCIFVQAGCKLEIIKKVAKKYNRFFPIELASKDRCTIGGNISTNAGGTAVLKYGMTRDLVLGLEVVLPNGTIIDGLREIKKDNRAYDLKQLFIGAEGSIGIITGAAIKVFPKIQSSVMAIVALNSLNKAINLLNQLKSSGEEFLSSFELNSKYGLNIINKQFPKIPLPFKNQYNWYVIIEFSTQTNSNVRLELEKIIQNALRKSTILDYIFPKNKLDSKNIWKTRDLLNKAQKLEGQSIKHDISIPISNIPIFLKVAENKLKKYIKKEQIIVFGHLADGNLHYNVKLDEKYSLKKFENLRKVINNIIFDITYELNGSFSAEHGIGVFKIKELLKYSSKEEYKMKRNLKKLFDPKNILNPGKIFY